MRVGLIVGVLALGCGADDSGAGGPLGGEAPVQATATDAEGVLICEGRSAFAGKMNEMLRADPSLVERSGVPHVASCRAAELVERELTRSWEDANPQPAEEEAPELPPPEVDKIINGSGHPGNHSVMLNGRCSGVVIHPRVILTAAHCTRGTGTYATTVLAANRFGTPVTAFSGDAYWKPHPNYVGPANSTWDVAVVTLASAGEGLNPKMMYVGNLNTDSYVFLAGWGYNSHESTGEGRSRSGYIDLDSVSTNTIAATGGHIEARLCAGDSGGLWGPWYENQEMVAGIQSTGQLSGSCTYIGGWQKAHRLKASSNWVRSFFKFTCTPYPTHANATHVSCATDVPWY
ncbi:MAG TPA: trypsin-like serine protease [Polyangiaceae bacterium]|nr:trypsin-like serine protease [Polyangiaceae bacterium]